MITQIEQLNKSYNKNYTPRDLTSFEIELFNSTKTNVNPDNYDLTNAEIVNGLNIYFDTIEPNDDKYLYTAQKLLDLGDSRGPLRLGMYYSPKDENEKGLIPKTTNTEKTIQYFRLAGEMGSPYANINLGIVLEEQGNFQEALEYYKLAAEKDNKTNAYIKIILMYIQLHDFENMYIWTQKGIENECFGCIQLMQKMVENNLDDEKYNQTDKYTIFYRYLMQLPSNDMIKNYLNENVNQVNPELMNKPMQFIMPNT